MNASSLLLCWQDLANFTPFPDEWTVEDKVLFEQAFQFHGKSFHRIRQMLPDKSIAQLVKYYYGWKKTRTRTSLMDRQARKLQVQREQGSVPTGEFNLKVPPDQVFVFVDNFSTTRCKFFVKNSARKISYCTDIMGWQKFCRPFCLVLTRWSRSFGWQRCKGWYWGFAQGRW